MAGMQMFVAIAFLIIGTANGTDKQCSAGADCEDEHGENRYAKDNKDGKDNYIGITDNERRILLIGKTGVGKSTSGNVILGKNVFPAKVSGKSITKETKLGRAKRFNRNLVVVDTPGLFDTSKNNTEVMVEIAKCYGITSPGLHAIVLVLEIGRFTEEEKKTVEFFVERFGKGLIKYLAIIFTGKDRLERDGETIDSFLDSLEEDEEIRHLLEKIENRYIAFGYKGKKEDRDREVKDLLYMIDRMVKNNGGGFYTNEMYQEAEKILNERWEEEKRREKAKHDAEIEAALKSVKEQYKHEQEKLTKEMNRINQEHKQYMIKKEEEMRQREIEFRQELQRQAERANNGGGFFGKLLRGVVRFFSRIF